MEFREQTIAADATSGKELCGREIPRGQWRKAAAEICRSHGGQRKWLVVFEPTLIGKFMAYRHLPCSKITSPASRLNVPGDRNNSNRVEGRIDPFGLIRRTGPISVTITTNNSFAPVFVVKKGRGRAKRDQRVKEHPTKLGRVSRSVPRWMFFALSTSDTEW